MRELEGGIEQGRALAEGRAGQVALGFTGAAMFTDLPVALAWFKNSWPQVDLRLREDPSERLADALRAGDVDLIVSRELPPEAGRTSVKFAEDHFILALKSDHPAAGRASAPLAEFAEENFILLPRTDAAIFYDRIMRACSVAGLHPRIAQETGSWSAAHAMVKAGLGVALTTAATANTFPGVSFCQIEDPMPDLSFWLSYYEERLSPSGTRLVSLLIDMQYVPGD
jgi:DNA-binding transcriptional LysR family regulator